MLKKYLLIISTVLLSLQITINLFADDKKDDKPFKTKESLFGEIIEVVGAVPLLKTVQTVSVTNREDIELLDTYNLNELLKLTPGLFTLSTGQSGQTSSTFIRGSKSTQTLYIIDGIKVRDFVNIGGLNLNIISSSLIDKVEIVRGPLSSIYGSDAQGGVVNIKTYNSKKFMFSGNFGSHNSYSGDLSLSKNISNFDLSASISLRRNSNDIENDVFKNSGISLKAIYNTKKIKTGIKYFGNFTNSGVPYTWDLKPSIDTNYKQSYNIIALPVLIRLSDTTSIDTTASFIRSYYSFSDPDAFFNFHSKLLSETYNFESVLKTKFGKYISLKSGFEYSGFNAINETDLKFLIDGYKSNNISAFIHGDLSIDNFFVFTSLRYDKYKNIIGNLSPQVGFSYLINHKFKLRASYSNSFKAPLITQQVNPWGIKNFNLKPEKANSYEIGFDYYSAKFSTGFTHFKTSYTDMIEWVTVDMTTWAGQYQNISSVDIMGYEFSINYKPTQTLSFKGSYTYLDTEDLNTGKPLLRRPKHSFSGFITYKHRLFTTSLQIVYVGKRSDSDPLSWPPLANSPSFNTFNYNILIPLTEALTLTGRITNAMNTDYSEIYGYKSPKRRFELGFRFKK